MSDEIRPALTAAEWARQSINFSFAEDGVGATADRRGVVVENPTSHTIITRPQALAALCLFQQPFGFSQEDIDRLRAMAVACGPEVHESHRVWLRSLASRIAALLPPEPSGDRP